jgi:GNAT superfamily N-acetyltransferase
MKELSFDWATDLEILRLTGSDIQEYEDHIIVKTPSNPKYHWGNCLLVLDHSSVSQAQTWVSKFHQNFPKADWISIALPVMPKNLEDWQSHGISFDLLEVLQTNELPQAFPLPSGYLVRALDGADWELLAQKEIEENLISKMYEPKDYEEFIIQTNQARKELCEKGKAAWFGAFLENQLVASLGIVICGTTARYQSVETRSSHRKKGLASHLLGVAAKWAAENGCINWVIVTESTNEAGRVYRRAGFNNVQGSVNAYKTPIIINKIDDDFLQQNLAVIKDLLLDAYEGDFSEQDWQHTFGGARFLGTLGEQIVAHAAVVPRPVLINDLPMTIGYLEGVAVSSKFQGQRLGSQLLQHVSDFCKSNYEISMLSTDEFDFYGKFGWQRFKGASGVMQDSVRSLTPEEDDGLMYLVGNSTESIEISTAYCDWREGDCW